MSVTQIRPDIKDIQNNNIAIKKQIKKIGRNGMYLAIANHMADSNPNQFDISQPAAKHTALPASIRAQA